MYDKIHYCLRMAKSAFQAQLSSVMEILTESTMKHICEIVESDFACLRLELTRALNENVALSDKMHALESEVEILRSAKKESRSRCKKYRSVCIQTWEAFDSPSINGIFGKEWCSSLWDRKEPRTEEKAGDVDPLVSDEPNDNSKLLSVKEENCERQICPSNTNKTVATRRRNPSLPSNPNDFLEVDLDDDDKGISFISAGCVETPEIHHLPSASAGADSPQILGMNGTAEHLIVSSYDQLEYNEHCMPIEFTGDEHTERQSSKEQGEVSPQDPVIDTGKSLGGGYFDRVTVHQQRASEEEIKATLHCSECKRVFIRQSNLTVHKKKCHQKKNLYTCRMCRKVFPQKNLLRTHKCLPPHNLAKTSKKRFRCEHCEKHFHSRANLKVHYAVHTGERPYRCSYCERGFSQKGNLKTHERIHKGERPFICITCGKGFIQKVNLKQHLTVHSRIKSKLEKSQ